VIDATRLEVHILAREYRGPVAITYELESGVPSEQRGGRRTYLVPGWGTLAVKDRFRASDEQLAWFRFRRSGDGRTRLPVEGVDTNFAEAEVRVCHLRLGKDATGKTRVTYFVGNAAECAKAGPGGEKPGARSRVEAATGR
jgi:hypothetical protein